MRTLVIAGSIGALVTALVIPAIPALASDDRTVIRYRSTDPVNTDLDLGAPGPSAGDRQVFVNKAIRGGRQIGYEVGEAVIVEVNENGLKASITTTLVLADGTLTAQGVFVEDFAQGPTATSAAITGGTGRYRSAKGEAVGEFIPDTDTVKTTIRLD